MPSPRRSTNTDPFAYNLANIGGRDMLLTHRVHHALNLKNMEPTLKLAKKPQKSNSSMGSKSTQNGDISMYYGELLKQANKKGRGFRRYHPRKDSNGGSRVSTATSSMMDDPLVRGLPPERLMELRMRDTEEISESDDDDLRINAPSLIPSSNINLNEEKFRPHTSHPRRRKRKTNKVHSNLNVNLLKRELKKERKYTKSKRSVSSYFNPILPKKKSSKSKKHHHHQEPTIQVVVNACVIRQREDDVEILLFRRSVRPASYFYYSLPGATVGYGEDPEDAIIRLLEDSCNIITQKPVHLIHVAGDPSRDPTGHTISLVYAAEILDDSQFNTEKLEECDVVFVDLEEILADEKMLLALDHHSIIEKFGIWLDVYGKKVLLDKSGDAYSADKPAT